MATQSRSLAVVTGASTGIGYELAKICAKNGFDLVVVADEPKINEAARDFEALGAKTVAVEADLATLPGSTSFTRPFGRTDARSPRCSPMPAAGLAAASSIRILMTCAG